MRAIVIRRDEQPWIVGAVLGLVAILATIWTALIARRGTAETEFNRNLLARLATLEEKVERLETELDDERRQVLALTFQRDGLLRENEGLTIRLAEQAGRILELEAVVAKRKAN